MLNNEKAIFQRFTDRPLPFKSDLSRTREEAKENVVVKILEAYFGVRSVSMMDYLYRSYLTVHQHVHDY